jgi:1-carboxybiuret hydrolase subunit AtzG-like protein
MSAGEISDQTPMTKQAKRRLKGKAKTSRGRARTRATSRRAKSTRKTASYDPLDDLIDAAARALDLKIEPAWRGAVKANLATTFALAALFTDFPLPDDAEPAPIFLA